MSFSDSAYMRLYDAIDSYLLEKCVALSNTAVGTYIRESTWEFPVIEGIHVLSIAMSVGMILWFDLRLLGVYMRHRPISEVFTNIYWWMVGGFLTAILSGFLLFWAEADRAFPNIFARLKFIGLLLAGLNILYFHLGTQQQRSPSVNSQIEARQMPRAVVINPLLAQADPLNIPEAIEHREGIGMFEHAIVLIDARRGCQNVKLILNLNDLVHNRRLQQVRLVRSDAGKCERSRAPSAPPRSA